MGVGGLTLGAHLLVMGGAGWSWPVWEALDFEGQGHEWWQWFGRGVESR